jgi:hypothetical protein
MSTTFGNLKSSLRQILPDKITWSEQAFDRWAKEAIQDYSVHFPQQLTATISVTADVRIYNLAGVLGRLYEVLQVEFPTGETPPVFLYRLSQEHPKFQDGAVYDLSGDPVTTLILGKTPAAGQSIALTYTAPHTQPASDEVYLSVPDEGLEVLRLYVIWKARLALEHELAVDLDRQTGLVQVNDQSADHAWEMYSAKITEIHHLHTRSGFGGPWRMDERDRVY